MCERERERENVEDLGLRVFRVQYAAPQRAERERERERERAREKDKERDRERGRERKRARARERERERERERKIIFRVKGLESGLSVQGLGV